MVPARHPGHAPATRAGRTAHAAHLCALVAVETATAPPLGHAPATLAGVAVLAPRQCALVAVLMVTALPLGPARAMLAGVVTEHLRF